MIIGITGGIASGKTYICNYLKSKNFAVFEADNTVAILAKRPEIILKIKNAFPELGTNAINREILRELCLNDPKKLIILQKIYYPFLEIEINKFLSNCAKEEIAFLEAPLLFEAKYDKFVQKVITVIADKSVKEQRAINRGMEKSDFEKFFSLQMSDEEKLKKTDYIIYSNNEINNVEMQIENLIKSLKNERNSS